jgi:hypothetical protein
LFLIAALMPPLLAFLAAGPLADVALPNDGFGAYGAFLTFRADVAGTAESRGSLCPCRRREFLLRLNDDRAFGEQFRFPTAKP